MAKRLTELKFHNIDPSLFAPNTREELVAAVEETYTNSDFYGHFQRLCGFYVGFWKDNELDGKILPLSFQNSL